MSVEIGSGWLRPHVVLAGTLAAALAVAGCGTPGAPLPPSLNLPGPVTNLAATRTGNVVRLSWTMPRKNTDKVLLKGDIDVRVCRREGPAACVQAGADVQFAPGATGEFTETLPAALAAGEPRGLAYFVEVRNRAGRSAGESNAAWVLAGAAPQPMEGLAAEVRKDGVVLRWNHGEAAGDTAVRLHRKLLSPPAPKPKDERGPMSAPAEPVEQSLLVEPGTQPGIALDKAIHFGETYEYRAQRVARATVDGHSLELAGELSPPIRIEAADVFPPAVPIGLAAVSTAAGNGQPASIDLSWQPVTDADLAGYMVYRREAETPWRRISGPQPLVEPAFHDTNVVPGHTYVYGVSAVDQAGHESTRSADAEETVPGP
jgi:hypothetical protein